MPLKRSVKISYGAADFGLSGAELLLQLYLLEFYIIAVGLSPKLAGLALAVAVLWDAVSDPVMGAITDRTRSRWGRFNPYLILGSIVFGLGIFILFNPPPMGNDGIKFLYLLITYLITNTGMTIIGVPHLAMAGAMSDSTHERTELYGWRLIFGTLGLFAGILAPLIAVEIYGLQVESKEGLHSSRSYGALGMGIGIVVFAFVTFLGTRKVAIGELGKQEVFSLKMLIKGFRSLLRNPYFKTLFFAFLLVAMARSMNSTLALPYYKNSLGLSEEQVQRSILSVFILSIILSVPLWVFLGKKFGKKRPAFMGLSILGVLTGTTYLLFPKGELIGPIFVAIVGGVAVGAIILFESMLTDVSDWDLVENGSEREGFYFGFWRMGQKLIRSLTLAMTGWALSWIGYNESASTQSEATEFYLRLLFGPAVGVLFLAAGVVFLLNPLTKSKQEEIQNEKIKLTTGN